MLHATVVALLLTFGSKPLEGIPLRWKPTDSTAKVLNEAARTFRDRKVQVVPFTDTRDDHALVGRNTEDEKPRNVTTRDDVGAWCSTQLAELLKQAGVTVVSEGGDLVFSGEVTRFMVDEGDRYRGTVSLKVSARDGQGKEIWRGLVSGDNDRFGRSYKADNYMETLSDSLLAAVNGLFSDPDLRAMLK